MTAQTRRQFLKNAALASIAIAAGFYLGKEKACREVERLNQPSSPLEEITTQPESVPVETQSTQPTTPNIPRADYRTSYFSQDTDEVLLARMIFGEARGCTNEEKIAVAYSAVNRVNDGKKWNGETLKEVILKPYQYSCFNKNDPNRRKLMDPESYDANAFQECLEISRQVLSKRYQDPTRGATHYFNPKVVKPTWAKKMKRIGRIHGSKHEFYRED